MKEKLQLLALILSLITSNAFAQSGQKEFKAGHVFYISLPDYMNKTIGLNNAAIFQYKSVVKDVYGFVIEDMKEDLNMAEMNFASANEFYENFINDFLIEEDKRKVSKAQLKKVGTNNYIESDLTYYDKDAKVEIYYLIGIVETPTSFYKVLSFSSAENKDKFKADFQNILYSLRD